MPWIDHFNFLAPYYDYLFNRQLDQDRLDLFDVKPGFNLLDAGGGTGRVLDRLSCPACSKIVLDESFEMLRQALTKTGLRPVNSVVEALPIPSNSVDRVIMVDAFHHVENQQECMEELIRVLKPGGKIIIEEPDIDSVFVKILAVIEKILLMRSHIISAEEISRLFDPEKVNIEVYKQRSNIWVVTEKR